jgi:hypothetical protein
MIPSASAISEAAISALPAFTASSNGSATLRSRFRFEAALVDRYREFVSDASRQLVYAVSINRRRLGTAP